MPRWSQEDYDAFVARTAAKRPEPAVKVLAPRTQPTPKHELAREARGEEECTRRIHVSIEVRRRRLLDPDNICNKFITDLLRYSGILRDDSSKFIEFSQRQTKVKRREEEETIVELTWVKDQKT